MLEDVNNYRLINQLCLNFVHMSYYGDQTHCEKLVRNSSGWLPIDSPSYLDLKSLFINRAACLGYDFATPAMDPDN